MRLQFEISEEKVKEIDEMVEQLGLKTRTQLFNNALTLFEWAIRERRRGRTIGSVDEVKGKYTEIEMPGFPPIEEGDSDLEELFDEARYHLKNINQLKAFIGWVKELDLEFEPNFEDLQLQQTTELETSQAEEK